MAMLVGNGVPRPSVEKHQSKLPQPPAVQEETLKNPTSSWETLKTGLEVEGSPIVGPPPIFPCHHRSPSQRDFC